jgi:hypothetical protein
LLQGSLCDRSNIAHRDEIFIRALSEGFLVGGYRYALVGIVGIVALVAIFIILRADLPSGEQNLAGKATTITGYVLEEGESMAIPLGGSTVQVRALAVFPGDSTGKPSALLLVNSQSTGRVYAGTTRKLSAATVHIESVAENTVVFTAAPGGTPYELPGDVSDYLFAGEEETYTVDEKAYRVQLNTVDENGAHLRINDAEYLLVPGESAYLPGATITVFDTARGSSKKAMVGFFFVSEEDACNDIDGQTFACRGKRACCGGICHALPDCKSRPNGPVSACGARQLFCCYGQLSLDACHEAMESSGDTP